jgi:uroporphyrinogen decarboxylase
LLDLERFWAESDHSLGLPFSTAKPRVPIIISVDDHWLLEEMRVDSTVRFYRDPEFRQEQHRACNQRTLAVLGRAFFPDDVFPSPPKRIEEVFGSVQVLTEGGTPWLEPGVAEPQNLVAVLDRVVKMDLAEFVLTEQCLQAESDWRAEGRTIPVAGTSIRGPITVGTSVCGTMNYLQWIIECPELMSDFVSLLAARSVEYLRLLRSHTGADPTGLKTLDDNCCLVSPKHYERFGLPMLQAMFDEFSPNPGAMHGDERYQHSDSDMAHLLPFFRELRMTALNLGPTVHPLTIRQAVPTAMVHGQVPPATLATATRDEIRAAVRRDVEAVGGDGGLVLTTAGSVRAGTSLQQILTFIEAADEFGRY